MWIAIGTTIGLVLPWIIMLRRSAVVESADGTEVSNSRRAARFVPKSDPHQGVTIAPCLESCAAASEQQGRRYLRAAGAPLPGE